MDSPHGWVRRRVSCCSTDCLAGPGQEGFLRFQQLFRRSEVGSDLDSPGFRLIGKWLRALRDVLRPRFIVDPEVQRVPHDHRELPSAVLQRVAAEERAVTEISNGRQQLSNVTDELFACAHSVDHTARPDARSAVREQRATAVQSFSVASARVSSTRFATSNLTNTLRRWVRTVQ